MPSEMNTDRFNHSKPSLLVGICRYRLETLSQLIFTFRIGAEMITIIQIQNLMVN